MRVSKKTRHILKEKEGIKLTKEMTNILLEDILELSNGQNIFDLPFAAKVYNGELRLVLYPFGEMLLTREQLIPLIEKVLLVKVEIKEYANKMKEYESEFLNLVLKLTKVKA